MSSSLKVVVFSKLNSEMTFNPDLSDMGKNLARNSKILPQNTVFWVLDNRRKRSLQMRSKWFFTIAKN